MRIDLLVRRVAAYFGIARVSAKVIEEVRGGVGKRAQWGEEPDVLWRLDQDPKAPPPVRAQSSTPQSRREIDDVPLVEAAPRYAESGSAAEAEPPATPLIEPANDGGVREAG